MSHTPQLAAAVPTHDTKTPPANQPQPILPTARQQYAAAVQKIASLELQLKFAGDRIGLLERAVADLQGRDEQYKLSIDGLSLRMKADEALGEYLKTTLGLFLKQSGIDISKLQNSADPSEALTGQGRNLTDEEEEKITHSLSSIYGVGKFSMKDHGEYPSVGRDHINWPSRRDGTKSIAVHQFDFRENQNSPRNNDTFVAWVDFALNHGPAVARINDLPDAVFNRTSVTLMCNKHYAYLKRRYKDTLAKKADPLISIKRKSESLDAPEHNPFGFPVAAGALDLIGATGVVPGAVDFGNLAYIGPGYSGDVSGSASWPDIPGPTDYNEILATAPVEVKPELPEDSKNSKVNLRSRRNTVSLLRVGLAVTVIA
ncbi:hypothetical protein FS749_003219 [Ceratobasidium sp. UAMH 11750]|nr:hypothetical protein FS749_003219 [Ceratobasidium sp. UAMH 11750]